jgi:hypothetical protein
VLNQRVKDGTIASWNWIEHIFGGEYRRALDDICHGHADYIWELSGN